MIASVSLHKQGQNMPISWDERNKRYRLFFDRTIEGVRIRKSVLAPKGATKAQAEKMEDTFVREIYMPYAINGGIDPSWRDYVERMHGAQHSWLDDALTKCRHRSKLRHRLCPLTRDELKLVLLSSNGRCAVTGIPFSTAAMAGKKFRPLMHSIDRIDSATGYTLENVRMVCAGVNVAMMHWGEDMFGQFAVGYVLMKYGVHPAAQAIVSSSRGILEGENPRTLKIVS